MSDEQKERQLAVMALHLARASGPAVGPPPSDEELAALLEQRLDANRHAQVLSHLLADEVLYARWFALRESVAWLGEPAATHSPQAATPVPEHRGLAGLLRALFARPAWSGAVAAALLAVILLPAGLRPDYAGEIDRLYGTLPTVTGADWPPATGTAVRAAGPMASGPLRTQLGQGLRAGMDRVGPEFALPGVAPEHLARSDLADRFARGLPSRRAAYELGRLTVVATIACRQAPQSEIFDETLRQLRAIREELASAGSREAAPLVAALEPVAGAPDAAYAVCASATRVLDWVARGDAGQ